MINNKLYQEIKEYCELNNIEDINKEINRLLRIGFNIEKYGVSPFSFVQTEKMKEYIDKNPIKENIKKEEETPKKRIRIIKNE
jgi:hypothetical protein